MISTETKKKLTMEEFMSLPYEHIELIDGNMVQEASPTYGHQSIVADILTEIKIQLRESKKGNIVPAPMDVLLGSDVLQPDLIFILSDRASIVVEGKIQGTPDVVFEIISPSNAFKDTKIKFDIYEKFGVKEYFIVYPDDKTVVKYVLIEEKFHEQYREIGFVKSEVMGCEGNF
jgi:Uma2 family endonuclease